MPYIVMTSSAKMPSRCKGRYSNVAVVETDGEKPLMISKRARHLIQIVRHFGPCHVGKTERCEFRRVYAEAERLAAQLNEDAPRI